MGTTALKIEKWLLYLLLFSIPFRTRIILRSWGVGFNEWNAAFLYFTDLVLIAVFLFWFLRVVQGKGKFKISFADLFLALFLIFSLLSIFNAVNKPLGFFRFLKLIEFSLLYFYIKSNLSLFSLQTVFQTLVFSGFFQGAVAIAQFFKQSSVGLKYLGESVIGPGIFNVAAFFANGDLVMRAYGTTPHPNVLASFLFLSLFAFYFLFFHRTHRNVQWYDFVIYPVLLWGFLFTFSRIIIALFFLGILLRFLTKFFKKEIKNTFWDFYKKRMAFLVLLTIIIVGVFFFLFQDEVLSRFTFSKESEAISLRIFYNKVAIEESSKIIDFQDLFGIGLGNFVVWLKESGIASTSYLLQPVHNIYLLILREVGFLGLISFLLFLFFLAFFYIKSADFNKITSYSFFIIFASVLFIGLFDHFLFTLQQGSLIFWLVLGFLASKTK